MNISDTIQKYVINFLENKGILDFSKVQVLLQAESNFGDFSLNAPLVYAKDLGMAPRVFAEELVSFLQMQTNAQKLFKKIEVAGAGFINIWLTESAVRDGIESVPFESGSSIVNTVYTGKKVLVEHSSPNLFKPFHIGHLMNNIIGEFTVRAMHAAGAQVSTMSYPSDVSLGIAKAMYIVMKDSVLEAGSLDPQFDLIAYLGECYRRGVLEYDENPDSQKEIKRISDSIFKKDDSVFYKEYLKVKGYNMDYFQKMVTMLGSHFDTFVYESEAAVHGSAIIEKDLEKGASSVFTKSEGAVVYIPSEDRKDINTTVFINSEGHPTYAGKDIGLLDIKDALVQPDYSFFVTDSEQSAHFRVVLDAAAKLGMPLAEKSHHIPHGRMTFRGAKMSSRLGGVPTAEATIDTVLVEVTERTGDKLAHFSKEEVAAIQKEVALSAIRIAILRSKPGVNIDFDPEKSLSFEGDSGPYLCYTHARLSSLLEKGKAHGFAPLCDISVGLTVLERKVFQFQNILKDVVEGIAPQKLVAYLFELTQTFNSFYGSHMIIVEGDPRTNHNLWIVSETKKVLNTGLRILGIQAPERM